MNEDDVAVVLNDVEILLDILSLAINAMNGFVLLVMYYLSRFFS